MPYNHFVGGEQVDVSPSVVVDSRDCSLCSFREGVVTKWVCGLTLGTKADAKLLVVVYCLIAELGERRYIVCTVSCRHVIHSPDTVQYAGDEKCPAHDVGE